MISHLLFWWKRNDRVTCWYYILLFLQFDDMMRHLYAVENLLIPIPLLPILCTLLLMMLFYCSLILLLLMMILLQFCVLLMILKWYCDRYSIDSDILRWIRRGKVFTIRYSMVLLMTWKMMHFWYDLLPYVVLCWYLIPLWYDICIVVVMMILMKECYIPLPVEKRSTYW